MDLKAAETPLPENNIWNRFLKGDDNAFSLLYNEYANQLMAYGMGWGFDRETLKDAIQDVFYKLYFNRKAFETVTQPKSYLIRALKNRMLDLQKKKLIPLERTYSNLPWFLLCLTD